MTSDRDLSIYFFGYQRASERRLKFARHSSNVVFEEFVLSSLISLPLIKLFFYPWRMARGKMGILKGFRWLVVSLDVQDGLIFLSPLNTTVSGKVISFSDISAVNFIVGWNVLACSMKRSTSFLLQFQREKTSSM